MANEVTLQEGQGLDAHLRPYKVGGEVTSIETSSQGNGCRITGPLEVTGDINVKGEVIVDAIPGQIIGYTDIGLNETRVQLSLTTSYVVPTDEHSVKFIAPPSGNVELMIQIRFGGGSTGQGDLHAGISVQNATDGYAAIGAVSYHEELLIDQSGRNSIETVINYWTITGLTVGRGYEFWVGFKTSNTGGTPVIQWGGSAADHNPDFIFKATALPSNIVT